ASGSRAAELVVACCVGATGGSSPSSHAVSSSTALHALTTSRVATERRRLIANSARAPRGPCDDSQGPLGTVETIGLSGADLAATGEEERGTADEQQDG